MTTGTVATASSLPSVAPAVRETAPDATPIAETLTLGGLCALLRGLDDPCIFIRGMSHVKMINLSFVTGTGDKIFQNDKWGPEMATSDLTPESIGHCGGVAFVGGGLRASALLAALEPCLDTHANVRVCMDGKRALADQPHTIIVQLPTDDVYFRNDPRATVDLAKQKYAVHLAETLIESGAVEPRIIAATVSALMPVDWIETRYYLDGALLTSIDDRLPGLSAEEETDALFECVGPTAKAAAEAKHGRFMIMVPIAGLTYEALIAAYGPKHARLSKVDRLVAAAASNVATAKTSA